MSFNERRAWFSSSVSDVCKKVWLNRGGQIVGDILCADFIFAKNPEAPDIAWFFTSDSYLKDGILPFKSEWLKNPSKNILHFILHPKDFKDKAESLFPDEWAFVDEEQSSRFLHINDFKVAKEQKEISTCTSLDSPPINPTQINLKIVETIPSIPEEKNSKRLIESPIKHNPKLKTRRTRTFRKPTSTNTEGKDSENTTGSTLRYTHTCSSKMETRVASPVVSPLDSIDIEEKDSENSSGSVMECSSKTESKSNLRMASPIAASLQDLDVYNHEFHSSMHDGFIHMEDLHIHQSIHLQDFLVNTQDTDYQVFLKYPP